MCFLSVNFYRESGGVRMRGHETSSSAQRDVPQLSPTMYTSTILIAEPGGGAPWMHIPLNFQSLQGPALNPLVA